MCREFTLQWSAAVVLYWRLHKTIHCPAGVRTYPLPSFFPPGHIPISSFLHADISPTVDLPPRTSEGRGFVRDSVLLATLSINLLCLLQTANSAGRLNTMTYHKYSAGCSLRTDDVDLTIYWPCVFARLTFSHNVFVFIHMDTLNVWIYSYQSMVARQSVSQISY